MRFSLFDAEMRSYEVIDDQFLPSSTYIVIRLDGRAFSRVTSDCQKPVDVEFALHMRKTCEHLFSSAGFNVVYAYTQSDEISLLLAKDDDAFNRKVRKLISILAGEASGALSVALRRPVSFDARAVSFSQPSLVVDYFCWRQQDSIRNSLYNYCFWTLVQDGLSKNDAILKLKSFDFRAKLSFLSDRSVNFDHIHPSLRFGIGIYRETYFKDAIDPIHNWPVQTKRRRTVVQSHLPTYHSYSQFILNIIQDHESP